MSFDGLILMRVFEKQIIDREIGNLFRNCKDL